eukprot:GHVU01222484.1.p2 GENE.GHVU01222484.1~~GHVU01222484.1.p2  ORF type:complete len:132 (+),score=5.48 GHVU01222484.1:146-541(+)
MCVMRVCIDTCRVYVRLCSCIYVCMDASGGMGVVLVGRVGGSMGGLPEREVDSEGASRQAGKQESSKQAGANHSVGQGRVGRRSPYLARQEEASRQPDMLLTLCSDSQSSAAIAKLTLYIDGGRPTVVTTL